MERLTYWNEVTKRYEVNDNGTIHAGSITDKLASYEDAEEQGLLHKAPVPNGTPIFILNDEDDEFIGDTFEPILETSYLHGYTEFAYGELDNGWYLTREDAEKTLKGSVSE